MSITPKSVQKSEIEYKNVKLSAKSVIELKTVKLKLLTAPTLSSDKQTQLADKN